MTPTLIAHAAFDEAGDTGKHERSSRYLIIVGVVCDDLAVLRRPVARVRKGLSKRLIDIHELKAYRTPEAVAIKLLGRVAKEDIQIYATIIDKHMLAPADDLEDWYARAYIIGMNRVLQDHKSVSFTLDKRYTNRNQQQRFVDSLIAGTQAASVAVAIQFADSAQEQAMQAVDFVTWSFFQRYEFEDGKFCDLLEGKIVAEIALP